MQVGGDMHTDALTSGRDAAVDMPSQPTDPTPKTTEPVVATLPRAGSKGEDAILEDIGKRVAIDNSKMVEPQPTPEIGCASATFFSWMDNLVSLGYARNKAGENLQHADLWELREELRAQTVVDDFERFWAEEQAAAAAAGRKAKIESVFWKLTKPWIVASGCFELLRMASQYASPMIIKYIIEYIQVNFVWQIGQRWRACDAGGATPWDRPFGSRVAGICACRSDATHTCTLCRNLFKSRPRASFSSCCSVSAACALPWASPTRFTRPSARVWW